MQVRFLVEKQKLSVPSWVSDLESFRRWADHPDFPEEGRISFLEGEVWVDLSREQLFTHGEAKSEINTVLRALVRALRLGRYWHDGARLSNEEAGISNEPDGIFVSSAALAARRTRAVEGREGGFVELEGSADMVLEVVSDSSVEKDTVVLMEAYAKAGIPEYWLVDARVAELRFDVLVLSKGSYKAGRKKAGWSYSPVFGHSFRLVRGEADGFLTFTLEHREGKP
jgi:Uma2 family endonuclease